VSVGIGYTLATGRLFCDISAFHEYAERLLARSIMTHEFASPDLWDEMRARFETNVREMALPDSNWCKRP